MSEFKEGDKVWGVHIGEFPFHISLVFGKFNQSFAGLNFIDTLDCVENQQATFFKELTFRTRQEAITAMIAHVKSL